MDPGWVSITRKVAVLDSDSRHGNTIKHMAGCGDAEPILQVHCRGNEQPNDLRAADNDLSRPARRHAHGIAPEALAVLGERVVATGEVRDLASRFPDAAYVDFEDAVNVKGGVRMSNSPVRGASWRGRVGSQGSRGAEEQGRPALRKAVSVALATALIAVSPMIGDPTVGHAAGTKILTIGMDFALTGAEAEEATVELDGAQLALEDANARHLVPGYELRSIVLNDATTTAGGYDPAQAATNARKFAVDPSVLAVVGPIDSGSAKAMIPILVQASLPMVAGSTTSPDLTSPKFASQYRVNGTTIIFFRTCGNEAFVEPGMVNYFYKKNVKSAYILDDGGAGGVGIADAFESAAKTRGIKVLGRDSLNPKEADYTTILTKIKGLGPDLLEFGGTTQAGAKLAKQAYDILPSKVLRADASGIYEGDFLQAAGFPAAEGWYATSAAPHVLDTPAGQTWARRYVQRWHKQPTDYGLTTYDAGLVVVNAIAQVVRTGQSVSRVNIRSAIQATNLRTLEGSIQFDKNGDLLHPVISIFRVTHDAKFSDTDLSQFKYVGTTSP